MFLPMQEHTYAEATKFSTFPEAHLYPMTFRSLYVSFIAILCSLSYFFFWFSLLPVALFIFALTGAYVWVH